MKGKRRSKKGKGKESRAKKRVLVTGSHGFVGVRVTEALRKRGWRVVHYDSADGCDILHPRKLEEKMRGCGAVVHLAAVIDEQVPRDVMWQTNVEGARNVVHAAVKAKVKRALLLSSTGVYGDIRGTASEQSEVRPDTPYEHSKAEAERDFLAHKDEVEVVIARSALVLGPNAYWNAIAKLIRKDFPVIGNGRNKWQVVYADDLANALAFLLERGKRGEIYNVAQSGGEDLNGLVALFKKAMGVREKTKHIPAWKAYILCVPAQIAAALKGKRTILIPAYVKRLLKNRSYDTKKIRKLGWKPKWDTERAVRETVRALMQKRN